MARRYVKAVGLLVVLLSVLALTVVAAQAKAGTGLGMSVLKLVAGHEEGVRLSQAPAMNGLSDGGCGMSCGDHDPGATAQDMTRGAGEASAAGAAAQDMTCGGDEAAQMHCGPMDMGPQCGGELGCGFEAEVDKSEAPDSIPAE